MIKKFSTLKMLVASMVVLWSSQMMGQCPVAPVTITHPATVAPTPTIGPVNSAVTCGSAFATTYVDAQGAAANYTNSSNAIQTICPANIVCDPCGGPSFVSPVGLKVKAVFGTFSTEGSWDAFYVFNGPTTASPLINSGNGTTIGGFPAGGFWGTAAPGGAAGVKSTDASGCLTFQFRSDASVTNPGWIANVTTELASPVNGVLCPANPAPCVLVCPPDQSVSLSGCAAFTIPANLVTLQGGCAQIPVTTTTTTAGFTAPLVQVAVGGALPAATLLNNSACGVAFTPTTLTLTTADILGIPPVNLCNFFGNGAQWPIAGNGTICFDYVSVCNDVPFTDFFGYSLTNISSTVQTLGFLQATTVELTTGGGVPGSGISPVQGGSICIPVTAGQRFTLLTYSTNGLGGPLVAQVSNITFTQTVTTLTCPKPIQIAGPLVGSMVGAGVHNMKFANPFTGEKCTFRINVTAQQPNLTCNDNVNISVNQSCQITFHPDMVLENYAALVASGCTAASFDIRVWPFNNAANATANINGVATTFPKGTHTYEIRHPFGQKCWGTFTVEDKLAPVINCGPIRTLQCYEVDAFLAEDITKKATPATAKFAATWADNCGASTAEFSTTKNVDGCNGGTVARLWIVTDASGNTATCTQHFNVVRNFEWSCPDALVVLDCKAETSAEAIAAAVGIEAAYPHVSVGNTVVRVDGVCNLYTTVTETTIDACAAHCHGNKKVIRDWRVLDWCTGTITPCTQIIKSVDLESPTFILRDTIVSTAPWYCEGDFFVPNPWEVHDNCDANPTWTVKGATAGVQIVPALLNGQPHPKYKYRAVGVPKGVHQLVYTATDCCGNETSLTSSVTVVDRTPPVPVAKRDIVIGLVPGYDEKGNQDGQAKLYCPSIDNGSYDNCSPIRCEIRRPAGSPDCGNLGNGNPRHNNNVTFNNRLPANLANNMPYNANDTDGGEWVKFCCADLTSSSADFDGDGTNDEGYHQVIMRVWDDGNMDGIIGNAGDNWNETWCNVKVECKVPPTIVCPPNADIACDWPIETFPSGSATKSVTGVDFSKTGLPTAYGVCGNLPITFRDRLDLNQCGIGTITRTFVIVDKGVTRTCVQTINVGPSTSGQGWETNLPDDWADVVQVGCDGPQESDIIAAGPVNVGGPCDVIGTNTHIKQFDFELGVCRKWAVEYTYTNWCTDEKRGPFTKYFMYRDTEAPVIDCADGMYQVDANCEYNGTLTNSATDNGGCIADNPDRWLKWTVFVDLWADGTNDYEYTSFIAPNNDVSNMNNGNWALIADDNGNGVPDIYLAPTKNGADVTGIKLPTIEGKMSNHKVVWKVTDGCHNFSSCHESFMVVDKKAPTPICVPLTSALMADPDGSGPAVEMVELWACDFINKASDNCTDEDDILYTFENVAPQVADKVLPGGAPNVINIDKAHYFNTTGGLAPYPVRPNNSSDKAIQDKYLRGEDGIQLWNPTTGCSAKVWGRSVLTPGQKKTELDVKVTVWDKKFNFDYCWTTLSLICNTCPGGSGSRAGIVSTENGQRVENVEVSIKGNVTEFPKTMKTVNGVYAFLDLPAADFTLSAAKGGDYLNGVSTLDLVLIQRHILGVSALNSPYKVVAADANNDGKVNAQDLTELRKLILGITSSLPNASWRFPIVNQTMGTNPFPYTETMAAVEGVSNDFVAVKIGDVNSNVDVNAVSNVLEARTNTNIIMNVEDAAVLAGEIVEIPVTASNFNDVYGYQFTMNVEGGSLVNVHSGLIDVDASNVGILSNGVMTMSYASVDAVSSDANAVLFTLVVKADKATTVNNMLHMTSDVTSSESYVGSDMKVGKVSLNVRTAPVASIEMFQNEPNPFKDNTVVNYNMPSAAAVNVTVTDVTGKVITVKNVNAVKGMNTMSFTKSQLGATGVLFYTLTSGDFTATKKMIIVE